MRVSRTRIPCDGTMSVALRAVPEAAADPGVQPGTGPFREPGTHPDSGIPPRPGPVETPGIAGGPGVLLVHDAWGLDAEIEMLAADLADAGLSVLAPDLFGGRLAGGPDEAAALAAGLDPDDAARLLAAAADALTADPATRGRAIGALGIGMGAPLAVFLATLRPEVAVVVAAGPVPDLALDAWDRASADIVLLVDIAAGDDPGEARARLDGARAAGRRVEIRDVEPADGDPATIAVEILADRLRA